MLASAAVAIVISYIYLFLMKCMAGCLVWFSVLGTVIGIAGIGGILYVYSGSLGGKTFGFNYLDNYI